MRRTISSTRSPPEKSTLDELPDDFTQQSHRPWGHRLSEQAATSKRILAIDAMRGYAMLGVAVVNAHAFNQGLGIGNYGWSLALTAHDRAAELISNLVFAHRSLPLLAFLLGVGLVVQSRALAQSELGGALIRRYLALLAIGLVHGLLLWPGDILAVYAIIVLVWARYAVTCSLAALKWSIAALLCVSFGPALYGALTVQHAVQCWPDLLGAPASFAQLNWLAARWVAASEFVEVGLLGQGLNPTVWALVLLGVWCGRMDGFWRHLQQPTFRQPLFVAGMVLLAMSTAVEWQTGRAGGWLPLSCDGRVISQFYLAETTTTFASVPVLLTLFAWLAQRGSHGSAFRLFEAVGRAPLTMFIGQSVVFTLVFNPMFVGLQGQIGRLGVLAIAMLTYTLLAVWIDRRFARRSVAPPVERLWRKLSSGGRNQK